MGERTNSWSTRTTSRRRRGRRLAAPLYSITLSSPLLLEIETIEKNIHTFGGGWTRDGERDRCLAWTIWNSNSRIFKKFKGLVKQRDPISGRLLRVTAGHLVYTNQISNKFFRTRLFLPSREGNFLFEREDGNERSGCGCRKGLWERQWMLFETRIETRRVKLDGDSKDWLHFKRFLRFLTPIKRSWLLAHVRFIILYSLEYIELHLLNYESQLDCAYYERFL